MPSLSRALRAASWGQRALLLALAANIVLILAGLLVVPTARAAPGGWVALVGALGMQVALALLAFARPFAFARSPRTFGISLAGGALFAAAYLAIVGCEFAGIHLAGDDGPADIYVLFLGTALLAGGVAGARTGRLRAGVAAAVWALLVGTALWSVGMLLVNYGLWGGRAWYQFWLADGAVAEFRQSGSTDLAAYVLQDIQGALVFHQLLGAVVGAVGGLVGAAAGVGVATLRRLGGRPSAKPA